MEAILLGIYAFFVWLIFIKFKLLPMDHAVEGRRRDPPGGRLGDDAAAR